MSGTDTILSQLYDDNSLAHFGIKGMKWGVRRTDEQLGNTSSSGEKKKETSPKKPTESPDTRTSKIKPLTPEQRKISTRDLYEHNKRKEVVKLQLRDERRMLEMDPTTPDDIRNAIRNNRRDEVQRDLKDRAMMQATKGFYRSNITNRSKMEIWEERQVWDELSKLPDEVLNNPLKRKRAVDKLLGKPMYHSDMDDEEFLAHFGIKGMKWGVRRTDEQLGNTSSSGEKKSFKERRQERKEEKKQKLETAENERREALKARGQTNVKLKYDDYKTMSDADLKQVLNRLSQEKQFKKMVTPAPSTLTELLKSIGASASLLSIVNNSGGGFNKILPGIVNLSPTQEKQVNAALAALTLLNKL